MAAVEIITPKFDKTYLVEVSFRPSNPIHLAAMRTWRGDGANFFCPGWEPENKYLCLRKLAWFRVVKEIPRAGLTQQIEGAKTENLYKLPADAAQPSSTP